jgi:hypothetical protein
MIKGKSSLMVRDLEQETEMRMKFIANWLDPTSPTFRNGYKSAVNAGFSHQYSLTITARNLQWVSNAVRKYLLENGDRNSLVVRQAMINLHEDLSLDYYDEIVTPEEEEGVGFEDMDSEEPIKSKSSTPKEPQVTRFFNRHKANTRQKATFLVLENLVEEFSDTKVKKNPNEGQQGGAFRGAQIKNIIFNYKPEMPAATNTVSEDVSDNGTVVEATVVPPKQPQEEELTKFAADIDIDALLDE